MSTIAHKTAPGRVKMKCMIWEPQPVVARPRQEDVFTYSGNGLHLMKGWNIANIAGHENYITLSEFYIYYDTFISPSVGNSKMGPVLYDIYQKDFKAELMFNINGTTAVPKKGNEWIWHQSFYHITEGLFDSKNITQPFWVYGWLRTGFNVYDGQKEFDTNYTLKGDAAKDNSNYQYIAARKEWRVFPTQIVTAKTKPKDDTTQTSVISQSSAQDETATVGLNFIGESQKPVHWMVRKQTSLYEGEDFFVEFVRLSNSPDDVANLPNGTVPIKEEYAFLDSESTKKDTSLGSTVPVNLGVIQLDEQGNTIPKETHRLNLRKQPYYLVELNTGDPVENYWLIIPWEGYPVLLQVGKDPVPFPGLNDNPPIIHKPSDTARISRRIGTYSVTGRTLMQGDQEGRLRITFQNHFGNIKIVFSGHEDNPWLIEGSRYDYEQWKKFSDQKENELPKYKCWMRIKNLPISIGAGNMPCGFAFSPLHYERSGFIEHPQSITVKGPVKEADINLLLGSKQDVVGPKPSSTAKKTKTIYNQDADYMIELIEGVEKPTKKATTMSNTVLKYDYLPELKRIRGSYGDNAIRNVTLSPNSTGGSSTKPPTVASPSIIRTHKCSPLQLPTLQPGDISLNNRDETLDYLPKNFSYRHELQAGSVVVEPNSDKKWVIPWCLTPLATGWTLLVPSSNETKPAGGSNSASSVQNITPVDVAQHVIQFSLNTSFSDNSKVEKSGSIRFIINPGQMTGLDYVSGDTNNQNVDRGVMLSNLAGKTFTIRIYAWWEGGFMQCSNGKCPCKNGTQTGQGGDYRVVFTGLCHGGQVTVENGKRYMDCQLLDYWKILQDTKFLNSPYFDGMRNFNAIYEILNAAGMSDGGASNSTDLWPPAIFSKALADNLSNDTFTITSIGGESFKVKSYGLPSSYDVLQSPRLKFSDGSGYDEAIIKMAQMTGYMVYFDRYGIFRFVPRSDNRACLQGGSAVKCRFFASATSAGIGGGIFGSGQPLGTGCFNYDSLALNAYTYQKKVSDVYNDIHLITTTPNGEIVIGSQVSLQSKFDARYDGYMGYTKRFLQMDGIFGDAIAIARTARYYSALFFPPVIVQWEAFGTGTINAGDLVVFTGLQIDNTFPNFREVYGNGYPMKSVLLYLTSVTMDINPERNDWRNKYEGEWIFIDCNLVGNEGGA